MRGIKVRIWDNKNKCMISLCDIPFEIDCNMQEFLEVILGGCSDNYIPMLGVGLSDKKGKEIYDGDILLSPDRLRKYEVIRSRGVWYGRGIGKAWNSNCLDWDNFEIVGNIKENPEY